ncbi:MAG: hypothetical protein AAB675_01815 [Patescibacteria group bacterium]
MRDSGSIERNSRIERHARKAKVTPRELVRELLGQDQAIERAQSNLANAINNLEELEAGSEIAEEPTIPSSSIEEKPSQE